jgi:hypothetical protein
MEADWEFEVGGDAPIIDAHWPGFVDVRDCPARVHDIAETEMLPGLAPALLILNKTGSPVWTCKSDVFVPEQIAPDELAATAEEAKSAIACYVDMLMRSEHAWDLPSKAERDCRNLCARMREIPLRCCRVDLVVRRAFETNLNDLGATVYLTACGQTLAAARERLAECLGAFAQLTAAES